MDLSKRERFIVIATVIVLSVLVLDRYVLTPFQDRWEQVSADTQRISQELANASGLFDRKRRLQRRWQEMLSDSLKKDAAAAESQVLHAMEQWSQRNGLTLSSLKPEYSPQKGDLQEIGFRLTGAGSMRAAVGFMWELETSNVPLQVKEMQLSTAREGGQQMSLQLRVSTIYVGPGEKEDATSADQRVAERGL